MENSFTEQLMKAIIQTSMIPNIQLNRSLAPILTLFLEEALSEALREDSELSGNLILITPEYPIKKPLLRQSTNINWLMYNVDRKQLLFVKLITTNTSFTSRQTKVYLSKQRDVLRRGGSVLIEDLLKLKKASRKKDKYQYLERKVTRYTNEIASCHDLRIIYILPKHLIQRVKISADRVIAFNMLPESIPGSLADEWQIIQSYFRELDGLSMESSNAELAPDPKFYSGANFAEKCDFDGILELCKAHGDIIVVGFAGGLQKLKASGLNYLENRKYKWDYSNAGQGIKLAQNWIPGSIFLEIINTKIKAQSESLIEGKFATYRTSPYWEGTVKFPEMFELCVEHGDNILIGFTGGVEAFAGSTLSALETRSFYRWDYAYITDGKNLPDWLPGGTVIELLRRYQNYPDK